MKLNYVASALFGLSVITTGCGGGGGGSATPVTTTLSGKVADGYLSGAKVCLDLNKNKICDSGEPSATSTAGGAYSLDATQTQIDTYPVVVEVIAGTTIDEDTGSAVTKKYTLTAPVGKTFVSPLTTMVQAKIESTGQTAEQIEQEMLLTMGQDVTAVSLFDDYVEKKADLTVTNTADYEKLHKIAQVTATTLANNIEAVETAISGSSITLTEALDALIVIIVDKVVATLSTISAEIDTATTAGTYDPATVATTVNATVDTTTIETDIAIVTAATNSTATTFRAQLADGFNWIWGEINSSWQDLEYGTVTESNGSITEAMYTYNFTSGAFEALTSTSNEIILTSTGWSVSADDLSQCSIAYNADNSGTFTCPDDSFTVAASGAIDVSGLNIAAFIANSDNGNFSSIIDSAATFSTGATAYNMTFTAGADLYELWGDSVVTIPDPVSGGSINATTLDELLSPSAWVNDGNSDPQAYFVAFKRIPEGCVEPAYAQPGETNLCTLSQGLQVELVGTGTSGTANFYLNDYVNRNTATNYHSVIPVASSTWSIQTINNEAILTYDVPASVKTNYAYLLLSDHDSVDVKRIFSVYNGLVYEGEFEPAGTVDSGEVGFDNTAIADIKAAITSAGGTTTPPPVTSLTCAYESGWDDLANGGLGAPITPNSFAEYESVVADCASAVAFTAADVAGKTFDENPEQTTFDAFTGSQDGSQANPGTGQYDDTAGFVLNFEWYVETVNGVNYVVVYTNEAIDPNVVTLMGSGFEFRETSAVIGVSGTTFTYKVYSEQSNYSDMVRESGTDGEIWTAIRTQL